MGILSPSWNGFQQRPSKKDRINLISDKLVNFQLNYSIWSFPTSVSSFLLVFVHTFVLRESNSFLHLQLDSSSTAQGDIATWLKVRQYVMCDLFPHIVLYLTGCIHNCWISHLSVDVHLPKTCPAKTISTFLVDFMFLRLSGHLL